MARATIEIIEAIRSAARQLESSVDYQWGHMGACNCGFLAQQVTHLTKADIHRSALLGHGDWSEQLNDYCPTSGLPMDGIITELLNFGFDSDDLRHLERLSDPNVLRHNRLADRHLSHNKREDAVAYMRAWADLLEESLLQQIRISDATRVVARAIL